ncbi:MAG: TolC family protein [Pseudomonadales bacterium]|nr:TolC family protein [Pseudomonadales bacterium]HJN49861.1 TolC family protein [Pseudomonadales bacterium]
MRLFDAYNESTRLTVLTVLLTCWGAKALPSQDDLFGTLTAVTSAQVVQAVLARNAAIPAKEASWEVAKARVEQDESLSDPRFSYNAAPQTIATNGVDFGQRIMLSQSLPWPGKLGLRGRIARLEVKAAGEGIEQVRLRLTEAAKAHYADWYFVHAALRINGINKGLLQEFQNIAEIKYSTGTTGKQDALRAEVELVLLEHHDIVLESRRRDVLAELNILLQRQPDLPLPLPARLPDIVKLPTAARLRELAVVNHPELQGLTAKIHASREREQLAERNFYPDINLNLGYNTLWNQHEKRFTVGAELNIPIGRKLHAAKREASSQTARLNFEQELKVSQIAGAVQRAYERVRESELFIHLFRDRLLPLADENLEAARAAYDAGSGDFLDLLGAEKNLMQTQLQLEQALANYFQQVAQLEYASGGPIMSDTGLLEGREG